MDSECTSHVEEKIPFNNFSPSSVWNQMNVPDASFYGIENVASEDINLSSYHEAT